MQLMRPQLKVPVCTQQRAPSWAHKPPTCVLPKPQPYGRTATIPLRLHYSSQLTKALSKGHKQTDDYNTVM